MSQVIEAIIELVITTIGVYLFGRIALNKKIEVSKSKFLVFFIITVVCNTIIYLNLTGTLKTLLIGIVDVMFYRKVFNVTISKSIFLTLIYIVLLIPPELVQIFLITKVFNFSMDYCYNSFMGSILSSFTTCGLLCLEVYIIKKPLKYLLNKRIESSAQILIYSFLIFLCSIGLFYKIGKEFRMSNDIISYLISLIMLIFVLIGLLKQKIDNVILSEKYENVLDYMSGYEHEVENQRIVRHEAKNELIIIKSKICDGESSKELMDYIDEILDEKVEFKEEKYAKFGYLPPNGIKGLLYFKAQQGQNEGLNISLNVSSRIENSNIYNLNSKEEKCLGKILGVFLDNAVEASLKSKAKEFGIEVYLNSDSECEIIIGNSFDEDIDVTKIGKERFSTKGKTRGHGLLLVNLLLEMNKKAFNVKTDIGQGIYVQTITIKKRPINRIKKKKHSNK